MIFTMTAIDQHFSLHMKVNSYNIYSQTLLKDILGGI